MAARYRLAESDGYAKFALADHTYGTRDFAILQACKLSHKHAPMMYEVQDHGELPPVYIGFAKEGKFIWSPKFKGGYEQ